MAIRNLRTKTLRLLWIIDLGALLVLSAPYMMGGAYGLTVGNVGIGIPFRDLLVSWLFCSIPVFLITRIWSRGSRAARLAK